jgi:alpha-tubulin suppressor-like RCC1 family protein
MKVDKNKQLHSSMKKLQIIPSQTKRIIPFFDRNNIKRTRTSNKARRKLDLRLTPKTNKIGSNKNSKNLMDRMKVFKELGNFYTRETIIKLLGDLSNLVNNLGKYSFSKELKDGDIWMKQKIILLLFFKEIMKKDIEKKIWDENLRKELNKFIQEFTNYEKETKLREKKSKKLKEGYLDSQIVNMEVYQIPSYMFMTKIIQVEISHVHGLALTRGGDVFGFGNNTFGRISGKIDLGNTFIKNIKIGEVTNFAISRENDLYGWGYNKNFLLCESSYTNEISPKKIELDGIKVKQIVISKIHVSILSTEDELYSWGSTVYYSKDKLVFKQMNLTKLSNFRYSKIESFWNSYHTIAMGYNKKLYGFGGNHYGQLRKMPRKKEFKISNNNFRNNLVEINTLNLNIDQIKVMENNTIIVTKDGKIFMCGDNTHGELNNLSTNDLYKMNNQFIDFSSEFVEVKLGNIGVKEIKCDDQYYYLIDNDNYMYKWKNQQKIEVSKLSDSTMSVNFMGNKRQYMLTHKY